MNLTPRPITASDNVDQSRDSSGLNKWARSSRTVGFLMFILGWFTIPVEVLLRRDFGQRWFTAVNYYAGFFLLLLFATVQYMIVKVWEWVQDFVNGIITSINPFYNPPESTFADRLMDKSMIFFLGVYAFMGAYHLFKIWWRNRTNTALHSFSDGTSRLEPIAGIFMAIINALALPLIFLFMAMLPKSQRVMAEPPPLINDRTAFTNTVVEPLLVLFLAMELHGVASLWLYISAVALSIHAIWRETAKLNKVLDFRDSVIDAKIMIQLRNETQQASMEKQMIQQMATSILDNPQITSKMAEQYPDLMHIIEEMNIDKSHLNS